MSSVYSSFLLVSFFMFLLSGCINIDGVDDVALYETNKVNEKNVESYLIKNTSLKDDNISIENSIAITINNLARLNYELDSLSNDIDRINEDINMTLMNDSYDQITLEYFYYLNDLIMTSKEFISALKESTYTWNSMLGGINSSNLSGSNLSYVEISNSINKPLEVFDLE